MTISIYNDDSEWHSGLNNSFDSTSHDTLCINRCVSGHPAGGIDIPYTVMIDQKPETTGTPIVQPKMPIMSSPTITMTTTKTCLILSAGRVWAARTPICAMGTLTATRMSHCKTFT